MNSLSPKPSMSLLRGRTVLVVEDSAVQRDHAVELVAGLGARVEAAGDGIEGLEQLDQHTEIDLVLVDLEMPRMDGITFIGELAARGYRPELVILSAQEAAVLNSVQLMAQSYGLTVLGAIPKPLNSGILRGLLSSRPAFSAKPPGGSGPVAFVRPSHAEILRGIQAEEILCYFQPQVTFKGAFPKGVEALVRWRHPEHGLLGPAAFLPEVESDQGLMAELTFAVLRYVAAQWHGWHRKGLSPEVSVNLSARSISCQGFADLLLREVESLKLPTASIVFELTESASVSNIGHTLANLARLRMRGFKLSIDDFGTGFATFEQLARIPFTELKVDRSIVNELPRSSRHMIMAENLLHMAHGLKLSTVAEGIETLETWEALRQLGCERGQGYFMARPMPGDQLIAWVKQDRSRLRG